VAGEALGVLGIAAGGLFGALWNLEKQSAAKLQQQLSEVQQQVAAAEAQLQEAVAQRDAEVKVGGWDAGGCVCLVRSLSHPHAPT
jgi:hypothetical protein